MANCKRDILVILLAFAAVAPMSCGGTKTVTVPENAEILGETTVATINGCRVGSGNFFETADPSGRRRSSIMVAVWRPDAPKGAGEARSTVFEGDTLDICGRNYRLVLVDLGKKGETGTAYIVPVD